MGRSASAVASADQRDGVSWQSRLYNRVSDHFLKLNATVNLYARATAQQMLAAKDPASFFQLRHAGHGMFAEGQSVWTLPLSYNPVGKVLAALPGPMIDQYSLRAWDAAALQRAVRLSYEIRQRRIEAAAIPAFLRQHPEWSTHPADGRPFGWDAATAELRVQPLGRQPAPRRFSIRVWQPPPNG
jgi:hypothetical protein